jgi:hypothetical protein
MVIDREMERHPSPNPVNEKQIRRGNQKKDQEADQVQIVARRRVMRLWSFLEEIKIWPNKTYFY